MVKTKAKGKWNPFTAIIFLFLTFPGLEVQFPLYRSLPMCVYWLIDRRIAISFPVATAYRVLGLALYRDKVTVL